MDAWTIGFIVGGAVVVVVVLVLLAMIVGARRVLANAHRALQGLEDARDHTAGFWRVHDTTLAAARIVDGAATVRERLQGGAR